MTAPGYVRPPVPGWWVKKNNVIFPPPATVLTLTGGTPVITRGPTVTPAAATTLTLIGGTPSIKRGPTVSPTGASLTLTGGTPRLVNMIRPAAATLTLIGGQPTPGYLDNFNRADNSSLGAIWTEQLGAMGVQGNQAAPMTGTFQFAILNLPVASDDRRVSVVAGAKVGAGANQDIIIVCAANAAGECTLVDFDNQAALFRIQTRATWGGFATNRATLGAAFSTGDALSIERVGTLYTVKKNGAAIGLSWDDTSGITPIDSTHRLVGIGSTMLSGSYRRSDDFLAEYI